MSFTSYMFSSFPTSFKAFLYPTSSLRYELQDAEYLQCRSRAPFLNRIIPWNSQKSVADDVHLHSNIYQTLRENCSAILSKETFHVCSATKERHAKRCLCNNHNNSPCLHHNFLLNPLLTSLHDNKPVYRLPQQSIRRLAFVPPYSVFCSISFRCGGLSIERNQKPLAPEITLAVTHHDRQKQVEVKRSSRVNPHEIRIFSGCPYAVVKQGTKKFTKK